MGEASAWRLLHATAVLIDRHAVLVRGASGSGKSRLAYALLGAAARRGRLARLVADDYVYLMNSNGRLLARAPDATAGLLEIRGLGIVKAPHEPMAAVSLVVDLVDGDLPRLPDEQRTVVEGVPLPLLSMRSGQGDSDLLLDVVLRSIAVRPTHGMASPDRPPSPCMRHGEAA